MRYPLLLALIVATGTLHAQARPTSAAPAVTLAIVASHPYGAADAVLVRHANGGDVLLVRQSAASAEVINAALRLARTTRALQGETVESDMVLRVQPVADDAQNVARAQSLLGQVTSSVPRELEGVGRVAWITVPMPRIARSSIDQAPVRMK